ncbi:MAG: hypothetical protein D6805_03855 [Planctomycetota bacterium]|nr:MAG: hypothetical protein D6805_03855 [Planctomycetota bacterium]
MRGVLLGIWVGLVVLWGVCYGEEGLVLEKDFGRWHLSELEVEGLDWAYRVGGFFPLRSSGATYSLRYRMPLGGFGSQV